MSRPSRDVAIVAIAAATVIFIGWLAVLAFHPNSMFSMDLKIWFEVP